MWLRALSENCIKVIANELKTIYLEHVPPLVIQSDQGQEFKGTVNKLYRDMGDFYYVTKWTVLK